MAAKKSEIIPINLNNNEENRKQNMDILGTLPPEIMQEICMYLKPEDIVNIWTHFLQLNSLMNDEYFWRKKCERDCFYPVEEAFKSPFYKEFEEKFGHWQATYFYREMMDYNWKNSIYEEIPVDNEGPLSKVYYFDDEMLIATTMDNKIKIFNSNTGKLKKCFSIACRSKIIRITKQDNLLACITELTVMILDLENGTVLNTLTLENRVDMVPRLLIHQNFVAAVVEYSNWEQELIILYVNSAIPHIRTPDVVDVLLYGNKAAFLVDGSVKVMNLHDHSITNLLCYSADNHEVISIRSQNEYVVGFCRSSDHMHFSVWNIESSDLVTFSAINSPFPDTSNVDYVFFDILEENKLAYSYVSLHMYIPMRILNYLTGETILGIDCPNINLDLYEIPPFVKTWNGYVLSMGLKYNILYRHINMYCSRSGKLLRSFDDYLPKDNWLLEVLMFTATKKLRFKLHGTESSLLDVFHISPVTEPFPPLDGEIKVFSIVNFETKMHRYAH